MYIMVRCIKNTSVQWSELNKCFKRLKHCIKNTKTFTRNDSKLCYLEAVSILKSFEVIFQISSSCVETR